MSQKRAIRVLRLAPVLDFGGVESRFVMQCKNWDRDDVQVDYACFWKDGAAADKIRALGGNVIVLGHDPAVRNPKATLALLRLLRREKYDVVHASIGEANFHAMLCARLGPWKTIIEEAGIPQRRLRNRLIHRALYTLPDKIICVSHASAQNLEQREWAPISKIQVIHNAIDQKHFISPETRIPDLKLFRAIGRLANVKNFDGLIHAFAQAIQQQPDLRLEIIGEGEERSLLETLIRKYGVEPQIQLRGYVDDIPSLHRSTGWLLIPSHNEGFGLVAAEAMAAGVPVIASHVGGLPEVLGDLTKDWTLEPTDTHSWTEIILLPAKYDQIDYDHLSNTARVSAQRFHPDRYVDELARLYRSICEKS